MVATHFSQWNDLLHVPMMNASLERLSHRLWTQGREIRNLEIQICRLTTAPFVMIGRNNTEPPGTIFNYFTVGYILISWLKLREIVDKTVWWGTTPYTRQVPDFRGYTPTSGLRTQESAGLSDCSGNEQQLPLEPILWISIFRTCYG